MIPRAAHRLDTVWSLSRQRLPRPARFYSAPSKKLYAPALATSHAPSPHYPPFMPSAQTAEPSESSRNPEMESFLRQRPTLTVLPPPPPIDSPATATSLFTDTLTQEYIAVMDACLHDLYDVPRAKNIFQQLRKQNKHRLDVNIYNAVLEAYVNVAATQDPRGAAYWVDNAWDLYETMEKGVDNIDPNASTYALMLLAWLRHSVDSSNPVPGVATKTPADILSLILQRNISVSQVIADRVLASASEAADILKLLVKAALDMNLQNVVRELGHAEMVATHLPDALDDGVPEVRPVVRTETKGDTGEQVDSVPFNLDNLRRHLSEVALSRRLLPDDAYARQKMLEESVYDTAMERLKHEANTFLELGITLDNSLMQPDLQKWMWDWHSKLEDRLEEEIKIITESETRKYRREHSMIAPYLGLVRADRLSLITILELMRLQGSGGVFDGMKTTRALLTVGKAVELEYKAQVCRKARIPVPAMNQHNPVGFFSKLGYRHLRERRIAAAKHLSDGESWTAEWTQSIRSKVGGILVDSLMDVAKVVRMAVDRETGKTVTEVQPAFFHSYEYIRGQKLGVIRLNPAVTERLAKDSLKETIHPRHLPMLVRPKPWIGVDQGGYLYSKTSAMRFKDSVEQHNYLQHASNMGNVELVYAGLDVLGSTPWQINRKVFDVVLMVWNSGERLGKLPPAVYDEPEPIPPVNVSTDIKARSVYLHRMKNWAQAKANNHSERCNVNYKIDIARAFLGETIYLPHNLDFRGRAYPIPPHLNHIGDDLSRGLLKFAEGKQLGVRGLRWLKIHLANVYGYDKASFNERVEFVMNHLDDIKDSAKNPLDGRRWWTQADDPWQCLATCIELTEALESEDPLQYKSCLPVHQDGTCNGLQHYAALGGDARGAEQVNLAAADRPSDVYSYVGSMVENKLAVEAEKGNKFALMLKGKISRKVVKQTVMTTVYGVTFIGAREQIEKQLKDKKEIPDEDCWEAAAYLARLTLSCIGDLFSGATDIQNWLTICARVVARSIPEERLPEAVAEYQENGLHPQSQHMKYSVPLRQLKKEQMTSVVWTTPLGLPIVQPYRKSVRKQVMTAVQTVYITDPNYPAEVNAQKQASAFPPNFIHSLDATHMMLTALECRTQGLTFASVHDSYWTHACDIDKMSEIIRETFIALHSSDVLKKLHEEFLDRYKGYKVPLVYLRTSLLKSLHRAGVRIQVTPEEAEQLEPISELLVVSNSPRPVASENTTETVIEASSAAQERNLQDNVSQPIKDLAEDLTDEDTIAFEEQIAKSQKVAQLAESKSKAPPLDDSALLGKFVDVADLIPPLPKKGTFNVELIKKSQYFFS